MEHKKSTNRSTIKTLQRMSFGLALAACLAIMSGYA